MSFLPTSLLHVLFIRCPTEAQHGRAEDGGDAGADLVLGGQRDQRHEDDEEEAAAVLDQEEGEVVVHEVDLGHVHVERVGEEEGGGEADDDEPGGALVGAAVAAAECLTQGGSEMRNQ